MVVSGIVGWVEDCVVILVLSALPPGGKVAVEVAVVGGEALGVEVVGVLLLFEGVDTWALAVIHPCLRVGTAYSWKPRVIVRCNRVLVTVS